MGISRSIVSHPFEILKIRSQLTVHHEIPLFKGLPYSMFAIGFEKGVQFYSYNYFQKHSDSIFTSSCKSSVMSTCVLLPYNVYMVNHIVAKTPKYINMSLFKNIIAIEYGRCILASTIFIWSLNVVKEQKVALWFSAFVGSTLACAITYPLDHIKNKLIHGQIVTYANVYSGIQYPMLKILPSSIIGMYVYELVKSML